MAPELETSGAAPAAAATAVEPGALASFSPAVWAPRAILAAGALAALVGVSVALQAAGFPIVYLAATTEAPSITVGCAFAAVVGAAVVSPAWRQPLLVAVSAVAYAYLFGARSLLIGGYALLVCSLAHAPIRLGVRVAVALAAWAAVPVIRWWAPALALDAPLIFFMVWAQLAYSAIYLLVEHARARRKPSLVSSVFYLTALPRLLQPFYQPISPSHVERSARAQLDVRTLARAVALGVYGMLLQAPMPFLYRYVSLDQPPHILIAAELAWGYCAFAQGIFIAVSLFRLMGFDMASGMRWPYLSESFAEYFTRWNTYVRDAVLSLFYLPLFLRFRRWLPPRAAVIAAGYVAILVGAFLLNQLLVPLAVNPTWRSQATQQELGLVSLLVMLFLWSAIVLPSAVSLGRKQAPPRLPRWLRVARFWVFFLALNFGVWVVFHPQGPVMRYVGR